MNASEAHNSGNLSAGPHWTDDQFSDYMLGLGADREARAHLEACTVCQVEVAKFETSVASFSRLSLEWSERQTMRHPSRRMGPKRVWLPTAAWALAAGLAVAVGIPMATQHRTAETTRHTTEVARVSAANAEIADAENSDAAIERDNRLMTAVALELDRSDPLPVDYATPAEGQGQTRRPRAE